MISRVLQIGLAAVLAALFASAYRSALVPAALLSLGHLLIPAVMLVVYGLVFGLIGADYGLPGLFWHDRMRTRLGAATAATLLLALAGVLAFFAASFDDRVPEPAPSAVDAALRRLAPGLADAEADTLASLARFLLAAAPPFLALLLAPAALPLAFPRVPRSAPAMMVRREHAGPNVGRTMSVASNPSAYGLGLLTWAAGIALGVAVAVLLMFVAGAVRDWSELWWTLGFIDDRLKSLIILSATLTLFYVIISFRPVYERVVSSAFAICTLIGLAATAYAMVAYFIPWPFPGAMFLAIAGLAVWFGLVNHDPFKLRFPGMEAYYPGGTSGPVPLRSRVGEAVRVLEGGDPPGGLPLVKDEDALGNWLATVRRSSSDEGDKAKPKLAIVAVSGGALRSGLWVAIVLDRIEAAIPGFGRHVRLITGASGGMVGASYYLLHRRGKFGPPDISPPAGPYRPSPWVLSIPRDSLDPVARFLALRDPFLGLLPRVIDDDRGIRLEDTWEDLCIPFRDLAPDEEAGTVPSMVLSPMLIEDGRRLLISNLDLRSLVGSHGGGLGGGKPADAVRPYSLSALEFYRLFPEATGFRLATGVRMNASFPYVSPAVNLPTDPPRRVFDAGAYDNYGIQVAAAWIYKNLPWLVSETSGVVLVQIRDALSTEARLGASGPPIRLLDRALSGFRFFTSAPEAAGSARTSAAMFRNDEDVAALGDRFVEATGGDRSFFSTVAFENSAAVTFLPRDPGAWPGDGAIEPESASDVALDWYLTRAERNGLMGAIPSPQPGSPWVDAGPRLARIEELRARAAGEGGTRRVAILKQLEQAENYERLAGLGAWWAGP